VFHKRNASGGCVGAGLPERVFGNFVAK